MRREMEAAGAWVFSGGLHAPSTATVLGSRNGETSVDALNLDAYYLFHAIRADLLQRLGRNAAAGLAYASAID